MPKAFVFHQVPKLGPGEVCEKMALLREAHFLLRLAVGPLALQYARGLFPGDAIPVETVDEGITHRRRMGWPHAFSEGVGDYFDWRTSSFAGGMALVLLPPSSEDTFLVPILRHLAGQDVPLRGDSLVGVKLNPHGRFEEALAIRGPGDLSGLHKFCDPGSRSATYNGQLTMTFQTGREQIPTGLFRKDGSEISVPGAPLGRRLRVRELVPA